MKKPLTISMISLLPLSFFIILMGAGMAGCSNLKEGSWKISSPDKNMVVMVEHDAHSMASTPLSYTVQYKGREVISGAPLGLVAEGGQADAFNNLRFLSVDEQTIAEQYEMVVGKKANIHHRARQKTIRFGTQSGQELAVIVRASDEGFAFRYKVDGQGEIAIKKELSGFRLPLGSSCWLTYYSPYYERFYLEFILGDSITLKHKTDTLALNQNRFRPSHREKSGDIAFPALFKTPDEDWVLLSEAATYSNYCGCRLYHDHETPGLLNIRMDGKVVNPLPMEIPWRFGIISDDPGTVVESTLMYSLNPPSKIEDKSWINPGPSSFPWLSDHQVNTKPERVKEFVDLASELEWKWIEFDNALALGDFASETPFGEWMDIEFIPEIVKYANSKGVDVVGWDTYENLDNKKKRDLILGYFEEHGFKGIKVDFLNSDAQKVFKFRDTIIKACADRKLHISFHGATIPRGQQRTWPHIMTWEGVYGEEWYTFSNVVNPTPSHNVNLCFTRNVVGSMDYTPTTFENIQAEGQRPTTDGHELALAVVFESGWQNIGATPEGLQDNPAREFLLGLPAAWDETKFLDGYPGAFIVLARQKGDSWYIAGINADESRQLTLDLSFTGKQMEEVVVYTDNAQGKIVRQTMELEPGNKLAVEMMKNGGFGVKM